MVKIKRNQAFLIHMYVCMFCWARFFSFFIDLFRPDADKVAAIIFTAISVPILSMFIYFIVYGYRAYELKASGITIYCVANRTKHYYVIWFIGNGNHVSSVIVFSKAEIDYKRAKSIGKTGQIFSKPDSILTFPHTQALIEEIRSVFPDMNFV